MNDRPRHSGRVPRPSSTRAVEPSLADISQQVTAVASLSAQTAQSVGFLAQRVEGVKLHVDAAEGRLGSRIGGLEEAMSGLATEVSLLRQTQVTDHAPRILAVEQRSPVQRAAAGARWAGKGTVYLTFLAVLARMASKQWPEFGGAIEDVMKILGQAL